jgi:hypothetical protein
MFLVVCFCCKGQWLKIVALCDPDCPWSLVIYTSTILVYLTWLHEAIRFLVYVQLYEADKLSCALFSLQRPMIKNVDRVPGWCE